MSKRNIDVSQISSEKIRASLVKFIEKYAKSQNIKVCIERGSKKGDNFIGSIFRVLYEKTDSKDNQMSFILKIASQSVDRRATLGLYDFFSREIYIYTKVLPLFAEFQLTKGVAIEQDGFNEYAKCYHSIDKEMSECLLLEDLCRKQMKMINFRTTPLTYEPAALIMKALGKFHAISFALKDQQPQKFDHLTKELTELFYNLDDVFDAQSEQMLGLIFKSLERSNRLDLIEKMQNQTNGGFLKKARQIVSSEAAGSYAVICHGDAWINNCMYKWNEHGVVVAANLIDWQFSRYASPVTDIVIHLLCCTTKTLRDERYDDLLKVYYDSFSHFLKRLGSDPDKLFPIDIFLSEVKKFGKYAGFVGAFLCLIMTGDTEKLPDMDDSTIDAFEDTHASFEATQALDTKVLELYDDLALYGYISDFSMEA